jgi:galactokinase
MAKAAEVAEKITAGVYDAILSSLYWPDDETMARQRKRYAGAVKSFGERYGEGRDITIYSAPGRVELCGNHTDHNNGIVLAAAVNLDIIAVVSRTDDNVIRLKSHGFGKEDVVPLGSLEPDETEFGHSSGLIRGIAAAFGERGGRLGGFDAYTASDVLKGSGLSSSAAFEVCVAAILNGEYNGGRFDAVTLGLIGQYAENKFFGKPSGLMDQTTCSVGGAISIDLEDPSAPLVKKVPLDLAARGLYLVVTDTKGDHSDLTGEYAAIRGDMEAAAACFGKTCLRDLDYEDFKRHIGMVRARAGDRAVTRSVHFFEECRRVRQAADAIERGDMARFLKLIIESGHSSFEFNQNAYSPQTPNRQGIPVALAISQSILNDMGGAWRLQGGGFAGTIQAFVPRRLTDTYCDAMREAFGADACHILRARPRGAIKIEPANE